MIGSDQPPAPRGPLRVRLLGRALRPIVPPVDTLDLAHLRRLRAARTPTGRVARAIVGQPDPDVAIEDAAIPGPAGPMAARRYRARTGTRGSPPGPAGPDGRIAPPLVVYFHGGGFALGSYAQSDWLCSRVARDAGVVVVSVEYRLAPEHPFPAAVDDAWAATRWLVAHADVVGADPDRVAVMGDSAGGNLAAVVAQLARAAGGPRLSAQVLIYPATDLTGGSASLAANPEAPVLTRRGAEAFVALYAAGHDRADPSLSPLLAEDLSGLPPALVLTAELDPIRDDGRRYATALRVAGVPVRHTDYVDMPHGFVSFAGLLPPARQAAAEIVAELRLRLHPAAVSGTRA